MVINKFGEVLNLQVCFGGLMVPNSAIKVLNVQVKPKMIKSNKQI